MRKTLKSWAVLGLFVGLVPFEAQAGWWPRPTPKPTATRTPTPTPAPTPAANPVIAYNRTSGTKRQIAVMNADGSNQTAIWTTASGGLVTGNSWAPFDSGGGRSLVFSDLGTKKLMTIDVVVQNGVPKGVNSVALVDCMTSLGGLCHFPRWSPVANDIVFSVMGSILLIRLPGREIVTLHDYASTGVFVGAADWSADGNRIVLYGTNDADEREFIVLETGDQWTTWTASPLGTVGVAPVPIQSGLRWSRSLSTIPDRLVFLAWDSATPETIYSCRVDAQGHLSEPRVELRAKAASWSPDDTKLLVTTPSDSLAIFDLTTRVMKTLATRARGGEWKK